MKGFYRYIYIKDDKFQIIKDNEFYVAFDNIYDALAHRDLLEDCKWDWDCYLNCEILENKYIEQKLPTFTHNDLSYIYYDGSRKKPYSIRKWIDGKYCRFGYYKGLDEAISMRDELIEHDWCSIKELKKKKREKLWK